MQIHDRRQVEQHLEQHFEQLLRILEVHRHEAGENRNRPTEQEQQARAALQEVELDYQLGNIAEPDYRSLRERYMRKALVALKARYEQELDAEIEEQLRKLKEQDKDEAE